MESTDYAAVSWPETGRATQGILRLPSGKTLHFRLDPGTGQWVASCDEETVRAERRIQVALQLLAASGNMDQALHKQWYIDQAVRVLLGSEDVYRAWVENHENSFRGGFFLEWNTGKAP